MMLSFCSSLQESDSGARGTAGAAYGTGGVRVGLGKRCRGKSDAYVIPGPPGGAVTSVSLRWANTKLLSLLNVPGVVTIDSIPSGGSDSFRLSPRSGGDRSPSPRSPSPFQPLRSPSPQEFNPDTASISSCPEMVGHMVREGEKRKKE